MKHLKLTNNHPQGKRYVIADVHGCNKTLSALVNQLKITEHDTLFFLGDYIDRGPRSNEVIEYIIDLKNRYNVYCLKGNHEEIHESATMEDWHRLKDNTGKLLPKYQTFFDEMHYYIELQDAILVHAGINFNIPNPFEDFRCMLWTSSISMKTQNNTGKPIIKGHTKKPIGLIKEQISTRGNVIYLDNGCYDRTKPFGNLCCLELRSYELFIQPYID
jgi:serine/threonine protein phosphatase 1